MKVHPAIDMVTVSRRSRADSARRHPSMLAIPAFSPRKNWIFSEWFCRAVEIRNRWEISLHDADLTRRNDHNY